MPFVKRVKSKNLPLVAVTRKTFIGRTNELHFFVERILQPEDPSYNIISISGEGGVGKSSLLAQFIDETCSLPFKDYCLTAFVDEHQTTPYMVMEKFATQLNEADAPLLEFEAALTSYKETVRKLQIERGAAQDTALRETVDLVGTVAEEIPAIGGILHKGSNIVTELLLQEHRTRQMLKNAELLEDPLNDLTKVFVDGLNHLTDRQILLNSSKMKRNLRVILFFDTFEQLADEIAPWLLDHLLQANISTNVVIVVAGRDTIEHSTPNDPKRWLPYRDNGIIYLLNLNNFTEGETRTYLAQRGITDPTYIATIWQLSRGLPLYLGLLTFNLQGNVDPTTDVVANFLRWIPEQEQTKRRLALDAALFSRAFNQDELAAFPYLQKEEQGTLYRWLIRLPFVHSNSEDGRYQYHDLAQEMFRRDLYQRSPQEYYVARRALTIYYRQLLEQTQKGESKKSHPSNECLELTFALAYQLFYLPDETSHTEGIEQVLNAYRRTNLEQDKEIVRFLRELPYEQQNSKMSINNLSIAGLLLRLIEAHSENQQQKFVEATNDLLKEVTQKPTFSSVLLAWLYYRRGQVYLALEEYQRALEDFDRAIKLDPKYTGAYNNRGQVYQDMKEYRRALEDFDRAIKLDPKYAGAYRNRGLIYRTLKEYQRALEDLDRAIELDPKYAGTYNSRGLVYLALKEYRRALEDFDQAIELDPKYAGTYNNRGLVYQDMKEYRRALEDFDQAIELDPKYAGAYRSRGQVYRTLKEYQRALEDFDRAIELDPKYAGTYNSRGLVYLALKEYQRALEDFDRAIELDPKYAGAYRNRGLVYQDMKEYQRALEDFDRAIELDPKYAGGYNNRGLIYQDMKEYQRALEDFGRSIELDPKYAGGYNNRSELYRLTGNYKFALSDANCVLTLANAVQAYMYNHRGLILSYLGCYEEAVEDYKRGLREEPDNIFLLYNMAVVMTRWKGITISQSYINTVHDMLLVLKEGDMQDAKFYGLAGLAALTQEIDQALDYLRQAILQNERVNDWAYHDIAWIDLRNNPRFQAIVTKI